MVESNLLFREHRVALVTGATGFVGSHLTRRLVQDGWQVHIVSRDNSHIPKSQEFDHVKNHVFDGSTRSIVSCVAQAKPDVVFHLASLFLAQHESCDIERLIQSNVLFGNQLLEAMNTNKIENFINTGTSWQHFNNKDYNPVCLYAATKQAFESLLEYYVQAVNMKAITLKLFDTYGPDDPRHKLFYLLDNAIRSAEPLDMSEGEQLVDLVHIDDVVDAYLVASQRLLDGKVSTHEIYGVSSNHPLALREVVATYSKLAGKTININWGARRYRSREVMSTWRNGKSIENWYPKISLHAGLKKLIEQ